MDTETPAQEGGQVEGQEGQTETPDYAGFGTPEELAADYQRMKDEHGLLSEKAQNLDTLRGKQGAELAQLRQEQARLQGMVSGMQQTAAQPKGPTVQDVEAQLLKGDITEAQALVAVAEITKRETMTEAQKLVQDTISKERTEFKNTLDMRDYTAKFIRENPGYEEAFKEGKLQPYLDQGMAGEEAWAHFQLTQTQAQLAELKKQAEETKKQAEEAGLQKGAQLEQGKAAAAKVLGQNQTPFQAGNQTPMTREQRKKAALETVARMRAG